MSSTHHLQQVLNGLKQGKITAQEAELYLQTTSHMSLAQAKKLVEPSSSPSTEAPATHEKTHTAYRKDTHTLAIATCMLLLAIVGIWAFQTSDSPTGFAIIDLPAENVTNNSYGISQSITSLRISGALIGEGEAIIRFITAEGALHVATITSNDGTPRTDRASYQQGDIVNIENAPQSATYYLDDGNENLAISMPFAAPAQNAEVLVVGNESGTLTTYRLPLRIGDEPRTTTFADLCEQTCIMEGANGTVTVETTGDAYVELRMSIVEDVPNNAPELVIAYAPVIAEGETTINLSGHFIDQDGDEILYSVSGTDIAQTTVEGDTLTITPLNAGLDTIIIYASDLEELVSATMSLRVEISTEENVSENVSVNETENEPNTTALPVNTTEDVNSNNTEVEGNVTVTEENANATELNGTLDCSNANPNLRPIECLQADSQEYFPDQDIFLENLDREQAGKLNSIGNLLIKGTVHEYSTSQPGSRDYRIGQPDRDGNVNFVAWIDTATGDLHLRGQLFEEQVTINPPQGSYSIITRRSIYLAYYDLQTGDLYLRGNLIPYRRSFE